MLVLGLVAYQFSTSSSLTASSTGWISITNTKSEITKTYSASSNGTYYFYVKDSAGNINKKSVVISNIDKINPNLNSLIATANSDSTFKLVIKASDSEAGLKTAYVTSSNETKTYTVPSDGTVTITDAKQNSTFSVYIVDNAGNKSDTKTITTTIINYNISDKAWTETLEQAVNKASSGDTIKLLTNNLQDDTKAVISNKSITFDLNSKNYKRGNPIIVNANSTLIFGGEGSVVCTNGSINLIQNSGTTIIEDALNISGTNRDDDHSLIANIEGGKMTIQTSGGTISSDGTTVGNRGGTLTIWPELDVRITSSSSYRFAVWNMSGDTYIRNATIENTSGYGAVLNWDNLNETTDNKIEITYSTINGTLQNEAVTKLYEHTTITQKNTDQITVVNSGDMSIEGTNTSINGSSSTRATFNNMGNAFHQGGTIQNTGGSYSVYNTGAWFKQGGTIIGPTYGL